MTPPPPTSTLFPYTTLFRSAALLGPRHRHRDPEELSSRALLALHPGRWIEHPEVRRDWARAGEDRKSTRLNSSHITISYAVFCLKKKTATSTHTTAPTHHIV